MPIATVNPADGRTLRTFEPLDGKTLERRIAAASSAFADYRSTTFGEREQLLRRAADLLEEEVETAARMLVTEMGKPLAQARAEASKCVKAMRWYAQRAAGLLADEEPEPSDVEDSGASRVRVVHRPLGVVLAVMPWNFPLWQVIRFAAPALMAGNTCLLKHASNVPQTSLYLEDLFARAGYRTGCFHSLLIPSSAVEGVLRDSRVAAATVTGSEGAGRSVASVAGDEVKRTVLELGGSDPFVVMPSADVEKAAGTAVKARVQNNGQSCIAAKRFIVHEDAYEAFSVFFTAQMRALRTGDPMEESTEVGPLASEQGRADLEELVEDAKEKGATVLCGGRRPEGLEAGWYYEPTVLADVTADMRIHREETFGPVACLYRVRDLSAAVSVANDTPFGLSSNLWTDDASDVARFERDMEAGGIYVNGMTVSHPAFPFGGVKRSGYGRELAGYGIKEFCNVTTVWESA